MAGSTTPIKDLESLRPGDRVDVHQRETLICSGHIEERMLALRVVWIRDGRTGERKMFCTDEHQIRRSGRTR
ncbi:hypothetical protein GCM10009696_06520 [Kocuria himachalensis]